MRVLYFSDGGPGLSVFESQVTGMVRAWRTECETDVIYRQKGPGDSSIDGRAIRQVGSVSRLTLYMEIVRNNLPALLDTYDLIHCRGALTAWMAIKSLSPDQRKKCKVLFDCRGLLVEEMGRPSRIVSMHPLELIRSHEFGAVEKFAAVNSDLFTTVSSEMSDYLRVKHGRGADRVIPCIIDDEAFRFSAGKRAEIRRRLGLNGERVFLYAGGTDAWQRLDILGQWWAHHCIENPTDVLLILTGKKEEFLAKLKLASDGRYGRMIFDYVPYSEVPGYMFASDIGVMFRDASAVSRVSSPVKLSEYLAAGMTVLTNQEYFAARDPENILLINPQNGLPAGVKAKSIEERHRESIKNSRIYGGRSAVENILDLLQSTDDIARFQGIPGERRGAV
ncbi:MAG: hypothetical protein JSV44_12150 [Candidatus Zixiibacteriota bacterium]|nr:MAG: hypothetical protein JSV44_12150 [candidate division Zixibacteria bacterium]